MAVSIEKVGAIIKKKPLLVGGILAAVIGLAYYTRSSGSTETATLASGYGDVEDAAAASSNDDDLQGLLEQMLADQNDFLGQLTDINNDNTAAIAAGLAGFLDSQSGGTAADVETVAAVQTIPAVQAAEQTYSAKTSLIFGGDGGGNITGTDAQLTEFYNGGSRNTGGNYTIEAKDWTPAKSGKGSNSDTRAKVSKVTGKSGTVESQLSGMSQSQKLSSLKKAGLI